MTLSLFNKNLLVLFVVLSPLVTWGKGTCYQAKGPQDRIVGASADFVATLWIQDTTDISDELIIQSGKSQATMALWCRDMETKECAVDAADKKIKVQESSDKTEIEFTFSGKPRIKSGGELAFSAASSDADKKLKLKKTDEKNCPPPTIKPLDFPAPAATGKEGRG